MEIIDYLQDIERTRHPDYVRVTKGTVLYRAEPGNEPNPRPEPRECHQTHKRGVYFATHPYLSEAMIACYQYDWMCVNIFITTEPIIVQKGKTHSGGSHWQPLEVTSIRPPLYYNGSELFFTSPDLHVFWINGYPMNRQMVLFIFTQLLNTGQK